MSETNQVDNILPVAPLKIAALDSCIDLARKIDKHLVKFRKTANKQHRDNIYFQEYAQDSYLVKCSCPRFGTGEAKGRYEESVRGSDLFIMVDVCNYSITYTVCGHENHMSPDDHYQDLKRMISAATGKAHRINVVIPFLYEGRQHKRNSRESLDCAIALQELRNMGINNIITFDAHDPRVQNAIPLNGFDNFQPPYQFIRALLRTEPDLKVDNDHLMIIAPDEGAMERAVYFSNVLGIDLGMFYKRRDYSTVIGGKNPIVAHEFLGDSLVGKDVIIIDDMISSGGSMLAVAKQMKERGATHVYVCCTFGLFTDGFDKFDEYYEKGYITRIVTTNLNYRSPELLSKPYYTEADMTKFLAKIMDTLNHDFSVDSINTPTEKIRKLIAKQSR